MKGTGRKDLLGEEEEEEEEECGRGEVLCWLEGRVRRDVAHARHGEL